MMKVRLNKLCRKAGCLSAVCPKRLYADYIIPSLNDEYTLQPEYPPIKDTSKKAVKQREVESWYEKINRQVTIEEKLFEINVPRYWGWKCVMLREGLIPYNALKFAQYATRTHLLDSKSPPSVYNKLTSQDPNFILNVKSSVEDELGYQLSIRKSSNSVKDDIQAEKEIANTVINCLHRVLSREIKSLASHIAEAQVDYNPRLETFWSVGGIEPPESVKKRRKNEEGLKDEADINAPINRWVQYLGEPSLQIRHQHPLPVVWGPEVGGEVPVITLDPEVLGFENEYRHGTSIPGFWPGDFAEFSVLSYHLSNHVNHRPPSYGLVDCKESLLCQGILSSFCWLVSLAAYQGFSPFSEITYPFVTQTVLTDGKNFSFLTYQLNTNLVHSEYATQNPKVNLCWSSEYEPLYERIEGEKVHGLNENVLKQLVEMYLVQPEERIGVELKPYLGKDIQRIAHIEEDEKRCWLEREFKHFSSNRPRHRKDFMYEIYEWERIYKIEFETRPRDPRRRPFELKEHPYRRKMSDYPGFYIPKALRPDKDLPKYKQQKFAKTYFPK